MLSKWHVHAQGYVQEIMEMKDVRIDLVWDEDPIRGKEWAEEIGVAFEEDIQKVLSNPDIDAVVVNTPTTMHKDIIIKAAKNNKHIFTEKVLALTSDECEEIYREVSKNKVKLMVSLPRLTDKNYLYAETVVEEKLLGKITMIRCRLAHNGAVSTKDHEEGWLPKRFFNEEETGGGAMIDLGAHPIYLINRLAGKVESAFALFNNVESNVDDNSVLVLKYEQDITGIVETSFLSYGSPFQFELYGTEGTLLIENEDVFINSHHIDTEALTEKVEESKPLKNPLEQWVDAIKHDTPMTITKDDVCNLTLANELALKSSRKKKLVKY